MNVGFYSGPRTLDNVISYTFRRPSPAENNFLLLAFVGGRDIISCIIKNVTEGVELEG